MAGMLLCSDQFSDNPRDQHGTSELFRDALRCTGAGACRDGTATGAGNNRLTWTSSTIPTTVVSTGGSAGRNGKLASLPRTQYTSSPAPAPVQSVQIRRLPVFSSSGVNGCTTSMRHPVMAGFFDGSPDGTDYATEIHGLIQVHFIDNADDGVIDGSILAAFGQLRAAAGEPRSPVRRYPSQRYPR